MSNVEKLAEVSPAALRIDGYDDALIGYTERNLNIVGVYSVYKIIAQLMSQGMSHEDAVEYFEYNIEGAYMGEMTPVYIYML